MSRPKVLITNPTVPKIAYDILEKSCDIITANSPSREAILEKIKGVDGLFVCTHHKIDKEILDAAGKQLKVICTMSAGYNQFDLKELKERNIPLANTPEVLNNSVADIAVLLTLAASRRLTEGRHAIESSTWNANNAQWMLGQDINGSTVGIVGLGGIGTEILKRLKVFGVKEFLYSHRETELGRKLGAKYVPFDSLISQSDFIIVACPLNERTTNLFTDEVFNKMKKSAVFVNISRGAVVDQPALIRALKEGKIFSAGLDVMTPEPLPSNHELLSLKNVVLLPHLGSATVDTRNAMAELTAKNLLRGLEGAEMFTPVNF